MNLGNCSRCGRIFSKALISGEEVCSACHKESEASYRKIFDYFATRPAATAKQISEDTGIDIKEIHRFVRENRLRLAKNAQSITCEKCGGPLAGGRLGGKLCDNCRGKLASDLKKDFQKHQSDLKTGQNQPKPTNYSRSKTSKDVKSPKKY